MAQVVWTEPALADLDAIADYIALENSTAARALVRRVFAHVEQLRRFPASGSHPPELSGRRYRQISEPPCRVFYRVERRTVFILHVMRAEQQLRRKRVTGRP
jgi:addiction module RelE/StbE family toxin